MKKTLVIMGTHPKSRQSFDWKRTDCDIWLFNEAPNLKNQDGTLVYPKADAVIQLHHEAIWKSPKNRSDEKHFEWLTSGKTPVIYMQKKYGEVPKSVMYPLKNVLSLVKNVRMVIDGKEKEFKYFSSSPDFAFALVADMWKKGKKYKRVEVWGIELVMESEYQYQRTGFGFWVGYLAALGIELVLYNSIFDEPMYGYEGDVALPSKEIEQRISDLSKELGSDKDLYTFEANSLLKGLSEFLRSNISIEIQKKLNEITNKGERAGILNGKIKESTRYLEKARAMEEKSGASVFSLGEFDSARLGYNRQHTQVKAEAAELTNRLTPHLKKLLNLKKGSQKRQRAIDELGNLIAALMNKNMLLFHIQGGIQENQFYIDSTKLSFSIAQGKNN